MTRVKWQRACDQCGVLFSPTTGAVGAGGGRFCAKRCYYESLRKTADQAFWSKVDFCGPVVRPELGPCWIWTGATFANNGYGMAHVHSRPVLAHRRSYELQVGPIARGCIIRHECDIKLCVRHLLSGTRLDNARDAVERDRMERGERRYNAKLTDAIVIVARSEFDAGTTAQSLAVEYRVSKTAMWQAVTRRSWRHVP